MRTFVEAGYPFPLFEAPIAHASTDDSGECEACGKNADIRFSEHCYECLRGGGIDTVMDTEFGMVTLEDADQGRTHGIPLNDPSDLSDYTLTPHPVDPNFPDEHWYHVNFAKQDLHELLRTPNYHTWQGERWLFCCKRPMVFRGSIPSTIFGDGVVPSEEAIRNFLKKPNWEETISGNEGSHTIYAFTCPICGALRTHEDCD